MVSIKNPIETAKAAAAEYQTCYGSDLVAVLVYGSAAGGDFNPDHSDINLLIVLKKMDLPSIQKSFELQKKLAKNRCARPLILDNDYINRSLDSFPIEFFNIKSCYATIFGADLPVTWNISSADLRLQCERELKGKWLHLIHEWLTIKKNTAMQITLAMISLKDFAAIFRVLLFLKGANNPKNRTDLFHAIEQTYMLSGNPFSQIQNACSAKNKNQISALFPGYSQAIKQIIDTIDQPLSKEQV